MEDKKIKDICSRYPWTEEAEAELTAMRVKAPPMFNPEKQAAADDYFKNSSVEEFEKAATRQAAQAETRWGELEKAFKENPFKVLEEEINRNIDFVNAFMDPKATEEQKLKVWPDYKDYSSEFIREQTLRRRRNLEKELPALLERFSKSYDRNLQDPSEFKEIIDLTVRTKYPGNFITPTDKESWHIFSGAYASGDQWKLDVGQRGAKKQITSFVTVDFEKLNGSVQIRGRKELVPYDRAVHDAIITLFVDGGNEYITPQMIYQVIAGNPKARLTAKQAEAISDSITKCMYSRVIIDGSEVAAAYGFEKFKYDGSLIVGERVTATLNGTVLECLHLLRKPILYEYADKKNQIGRFDIKLLNSPINKTEETITLQDYLCRRILSMKGSSSLSKTIVYETVYNQIEIKAATDGALRKKKSKVRGQIKSILDFWKQEGFILGYVENTRKTEIYSVTIRV